MPTEFSAVAQEPRRLVVAGNQLTLYPPTIFRLKAVMSAALGLVAKTELMDQAKLDAQKFIEEEKKKIAEPGYVYDELALKQRAGQFVVDALMELFQQAPEELAKLMTEICRPNKPNEQTPKEFTSRDFWEQQATISEIQMVLSHFIDLIDIGPLLKNVGRLKGIM